MPFPKFKHHVCLVSEQTLPNYLGAVMPDALPEKVHLIVTDKVTHEAEILKFALSARNIDVKQYHLAEVRRVSMHNLLKKIWEKIDQKSIAINVTGGTKIMTLAAVEWASSIQDDPPFLFYVDTANKKILQIGGKRAEFDITEQLKIKELIEAKAGVTIKQNLHPTTPTNLLKSLLKTFLQSKRRYILSQFNKCAVEAKDRLYTEMPFDHSSEFKQVLDLATQAGKLKLNKDSATISYPSEEARFWCNGGWFEEYVQALLSTLKLENIIDDWGGNIEIIDIPSTNENFQHIRPDQNINELDAAIAKANRLFIIECKTADLTKPNSFAPVAYKLDSVTKKFGGSLSGGLLASVYDISPTARKRCNDLKILPVCGNEVLYLKEKIKKWIA